MKYLAIFIFVCFIQTITYSQVADDHADCNAARKALNEGKINEAIIGFKKGAAKNCSSSMNMLGVIYSYADYQINNYVEAKKWFVQAANAYNDDARTNLALMAANGHGEPRNFKKSALQLKELLKERVTMYSIESLANIFLTDTTAIDQETVRKYLDYAMASDVPESYILLAYVMLTKPKSGDDPIYFLKKAQENDITDAVMILGELYEQGSSFNGKDLLAAKRYYAEGVGHKLDGAQEAYDRVVSKIQKEK